METKQLSDILDVQILENSVNRKKLFIDIFKKYLYLKYGTDDISGFCNDYRAKIEQIDNGHDGTTKVTSTDSLKRKLRRLLNYSPNNKNAATSVVPRYTIIQIAFVLTEELSDEYDRLKITNNMLLNMGFPMLRASSEKEIFLIHALTKRKSYKKCIELFEEYKKYKSKKEKESAPLCSDEFENKTTTYYYNRALAIPDNDLQLFEDVYDMSSNMSWASKRIQTEFNDTMTTQKAKRMENIFRSKIDELTCKPEYDNCSYIVVRNGLLANDMKSNTWHLFIPGTNKEEKLELSKNDMIRLNNYFYIVFLHSDKHYCLYRDNKKVGFLLANKVKNLFDSNHSKIKLECEFYLSFSKTEELCGIDCIQSFREKFPEHRSTGITRDSYFDYIGTLYMDFVPIKSAYIRTVCDGIDSVTKGSAMLSREAYILWLLFCGYSTAEINATISKRYDALNPKIYFDLYAMIIGNFKIDNSNKKIIYRNPFNMNEQYIVENDLGIELTNEQTLRSNIIKELTICFNKDFAADAFINSANSTVVDLF